MSTILALAVLLCQDPPPPAVTTGSDAGSAVRLQLTGRLDLHYLYRGGEIDQAGGTLNAIAPPPTGSQNFWSGRVSLRTDLEVKDFVTGVIELENRSFESGINKPFGAVPPDSAVQVKQGFIDVGQFLTPELNVRIGLQNLTFRNRPQDEPFFMDLGESEGFTRGFQPLGSTVVNTVDRDITQAAGVRFFYSPFEIMSLQAFWLVAGEGGGTPLDESVYGFVANSLLGENWSAWLLFAVVTGGGNRLGEIGTLGLGVDGYFGEDKALELFVEGYAQGGTLQHAPGAVHKHAYAFNLGARYLGFFEKKLWLEAALSRRSGDRHPGDDHDQSFQSYENVNRFLILESGEFGLDVDTNLTCARLAVGAGPFPVSGRPLRIQLDLGRFAAVAPVLASGRQWGIESDLSFAWAYNESFTLSLRGAWLGDSDLLKRLTGENHARLVVFGADLKF
ncbi:MAG: hypothetical protein HY293_14210 [Planctomycetes bacterium]|nr:hypothetical protein [Planctomycetota bacterium]